MSVSDAFEVVYSLALLHAEDDEATKEKNILALAVVHDFVINNVLD